MPQIILGIDIGTYSVKVVEIERGFGEFKLTAFHELPLVAQEVLTYEQAASASLSQFFENHPINYDSCIMSFPGSYAAFRILDLPFANIRKVDQTFEFELETAIPFDIEDVLYDYGIINSTSDSSQVLAGYIQREEFDRFLSQIQLSPVDPRYVGIDTLDLNCLNVLALVPPRGRYAILDLGHRKSNLVMMDGDKIKNLRCFSWGGQEITCAIAEAFEISYDEAEKMKHSKGNLASQRSEDRLEQIVEEKFSELMQQLRQTLFSFQENGDGMIEALYLCGGSSRTSGVESFFARHLKINVSPLDLYDENYVRIPQWEEAQTIIPTALSQALRGVYPNKGLRFNLRRGDYAYKKDIEQLSGHVRKLGMMVASVAVLGLAYFLLSYFTLSSQVDKMNQNLSRQVSASVRDLPKRGVTSANSALSILEGKISSMQENLKKTSGEGVLSPIEVLKMISSAMPSREAITVDIDKINITNDKVTMEVRTMTYENVDQIKAAMSQIKAFKNVESGDVKKFKDQVKFNLFFSIAESV